MKKIIAGLLVGLIVALGVGTASAVVIEGQIAPGSYVPIAADSSGNLLTATSGTATPNGPPPNLVSTANSTVAVLGANAVFTGTSEDVSKYSEIRVSIFSDVASATDGLTMQQSKDGTNWDTVDSYSIPASTGKTFGVGVSEQFFRIVYTNGGTIQTAMRLSTVYHGVATKPSAVRPQDARPNDNDFEEVMAYGSVFNGTSWDRIRGANGTVFVNGAVAHSQPQTGNPVTVGGTVRTAVDTSLVAVDVGALAITSGGAVITKPWAAPETDWSYVAAAGGISNTLTAVTIKVAAGAGIRNYITSCHISSDALGAATELVIRDGAGGTVLIRIKLGTAGVTGGENIVFPSPLRGTANTLLEVATLTASITGAIYVNCGGYIAV